MTDALANLILEELRRIKLDQAELRRLLQRNVDATRDSEHAVKSAELAIKADFDLLLKSELMRLKPDLEAVIELRLAQFLVDFAKRATAE